MKVKVLLACLVLLISTFAKAQDFSLYEKHQLVQGADTLPYRVLLPKNYDAAKKYPLVIVLHGSGERGSDNEKQLVHGGNLFLKDSLRDKYPAIVIFPQCSAASRWANIESVIDSLTKKRTITFLEAGEPTTAMKLLLQLTDNLQKDYKLDKKKIYVGGLSMGGMGTFELVRRKPKLFAAAFPICGGANTATASQITQPHWWIFHGEKDDVVNPQFSKEMAAALKTAGADVKLTLYPDASHNSWDSAFAEKDLLPWLFSNHK